MTQTQSDDLVTRLQRGRLVKESEPFQIDGATAWTGEVRELAHPDALEAAAEIQRLQAQVAAMHESLAAVTDSLEAEIGDRYKGMLPQLESRYNRDMADVILARVMLASIEGVAG